MPQAERESSALVRDPGRITEIKRALLGGDVSAVEVTTQFLDRIQAAEPQVHAWRELDGERALATAAQLDTARSAGEQLGPLHGVPIAVKDIIDVAGLPTRCNSATLANAASATADAAIVATLRSAGAVVLGKANTTEFAFYDPSPACNPHNPGHTPGGSSSGSAAAVAAGMVPAALGTQTVASVNRPASYCGIAAFKPSSGLTNTFGIAPLAPMYDTVGFYGRRVVDAVALFEAVCPTHAAAPAPLAADAGLRVTRLIEPALAAASDEVSNVLDQVAAHITSAGHKVTEQDSPVSFETLREQQWRTTLYEAGRIYRHLLDAPPEQVGTRLREAIVEGLAIEFAEYTALRTAIAAARVRLSDTLRDTDAVLWPAAPGTAPEGLAWTGDPRFISPWTAIGGPVVSVPAGFGATQLPIGVLIVGAPGEDRRMTQVATRLAEAFEI